MRNLVQPGWRRGKVSATVITLVEIPFCYWVRFPKWSPRQGTAGMSATICTRACGD